MCMLDINIDGIRQWKRTKGTHLCVLIIYIISEHPDNWFIKVMPLSLLKLLSHLICFIYTRINMVRQCQQTYISTQIPKNWHTID